MKQLSTLIICIALSTFCFSQDQTKKSAEISSFFIEIMTTNPNNVEFREGSNEKLFMLLEANPEAFILALAKAKVETSKRITSELQSPDHDGFDLQKIYSTVYKVESNKKSKSVILEALKEAGWKLGLELDK